MDVGDILVEFRRTGGRAGNDEHLVVGRDGQAMLRTPDGTQRLELGPASVEHLRGAAGRGWIHRVARGPAQPPRGG